MAFFNKKEEVMDIELTQYGKYLLSQGKFKPVFYAFFDDDIIYDQRYASGSALETQNDIQDRILVNTPSTKTQYLFHSVDNIGIQNQLKRVLYSGETDKIQQMPERHYVLSDPLGDSELRSNYAPSFNIQVEKGSISGSARVISGSTNKTLSTVNIPQINLDDVFYHTFISDLETDSMESRPEIFFEFDDGTYVNVKEDHIMMTIVEENTGLSKHNFDIEVYQMNENEDTWEPLYFKKPRETMRDGILLDQEEIDFEGTRFHEEEASPGNIPPENLHDVDEAAYYFDILVDGEIE